MKKNILPIDRDRYLVENRIEKYGILPYKVRHSRYSSLSEAQKGGRAIAKQFKNEYVDNPSDWKNVINIYDKRPKNKFKIKNKTYRRK